MIHVNGCQIKPTVFPDGTQQVWQLREECFFSPHVRSSVCWRFENESEFITILQLAQLIQSKTASYIDYVIPYLPYARQDKDISNSSCFGLTTFLNVFRSQSNAGRITIFDPHSSNLLRLYFSLGMTILLPRISKLAKGYDYVCFPDAGASKRYPHSLPTLVGNKVRDQETGWITSYELDSEDNLTDKKVLVVDDICDGGATFKFLGKELVERKAKPDLYISHGIFSKGQQGVNELREYYSRIVTTNSLVSNDNPLDGVTVLDWRSVI